MNGKHCDNIIIGGGLAGLSTAYFCDKPVLVLEKNDTLGGLCRSYTEDGFTFDYTGHLLHLKHKWTKELVQRLFGGNLRRIERKAGIYSHESYTPYPFQANTFGLPPEVVQESLVGFIRTLIDKGEDVHTDDNYKKWIDRTFGSGIAKHFMIPYNRKLWRCELEQLSTEWVSDYIPKPSLEMVVDGALGIRSHTLGYNAYFYYPKNGGIQGLIEGLSSSVDNFRTGVEVTSIDIENRWIETSDGKRIDYRYLISTIPLPRLLDIIEPLPEAMRDLSCGLEYVSVLNINLGVSREKISPYHWLYFPEEDFVFYRCGFPTNFSDSLAPKRTSSIYVEISAAKGEVIDQDDAYSRAVDGLVRCGILKTPSEIIHRSFRFIDVAYVIYNHDRSEAVRRILDYLGKGRILSIGRFGAWEYSAMEEAILWGKGTAERISR